MTVAALSAVATEEVMQLVIQDSVEEKLLCNISIKLQGLFTASIITTAREMLTHTQKFGTGFY